MKTKTLLVFLLCCFCFCQITLAQDPVPEDYFDLFDNEETEEEGDDQIKTPMEELWDMDPSMKEGDKIKAILNNSGAVGSFGGNAISSYNMVMEGCDATYVCMYNTLKKVYKIYLYEKALSEKEEKLGCSRKKELLQDYALFIVSMNLDLYCIEQLHPDGNELEDFELINAMLAMGDIVDDSRRDTDVSEPVFLPMLIPYRRLRPKVNPYCSEDLIIKNRESNVRACDYGDYSGTLDLEEKNKLLKNIRTIIDDINPMWQMSRAIQINQHLKALPCK